MKQGNVRGLAHNQLLILMTSRFYNSEWYSKHPPHPYMLDLETNTFQRDLLFKDVLEFCMKTDVCKQLNVSVMDLMQLDLATYTTLKEIIREDNERKAKIIADQQRDLDDKQKQFGGLYKDVSRRNGRG